MPASLHDRVISRLEEGDRGDRGWWLVTRVHLEAARLQRMAAYLRDVADERGRRVLTASDYTALGRASEVTSPDPGIQLRRHQLLAMESPLNLLRRVDGRSWQEVELTVLGKELAESAQTSSVLDGVLQQIVFCQEPWYPPSRVQQYADFGVRPYVATLRTLAGCGDWIDRDEFDLFLSRVRTEEEVPWAIDGVTQYRELEPDERHGLLREVQKRVPGTKAYQNWRDMGLHTFSLLALGASVVRQSQRLLLTRFAVAPPEPGRRRERDAPRPAALVALRVPDPPSNEELTVPPTAPVSNVGTDAELLVGKILSAAGYRVIFYSNRRGYGFDIWAGRGGKAMLVEVKSGYGSVGTLTLTRLEYEAAQRYGANYVLAVVENLPDAPVVYFVANPARSLRLQTRNTTEYVTGRQDWFPVAIRDTP